MKFSAAILAAAAALLPSACQAFAPMGSSSAALMRPATGSALPSMDIFNTKLFMAEVGFNIATVWNWIEVN